jgi:YD repeat-containing protein
VHHPDSALSFQAISSSYGSGRSRPRAFRFYLALAGILSVIFWLPRADAQAPAPSTASDQTGVSPYQSLHGGDIDIVSLTNGTLTINTPFLSYPQRGKLKLDFNLMYNNQLQHFGWHCILVNKTNECNWGWDYMIAASPLPAEKSDVFVGWAQQLAITGVGVCPDSACGATMPPYPYYYGNWALQTADGSKHTLGNRGTMSWTYSSGIGYFEDQTGPFETLDASGWQVNQALNVTSPFSTYGTCCLGATVTKVVGPDGVAYGSKIVDPNGNYITPTSSGFTDSLGRQIPSPPLASSSGNTSTAVCPVLGGSDPPVAFAVSWTPPEYNGGNTPYTFCYAKLAINEPPVNPLGYPLWPYAASRTVLQSIVLPNGQTWRFEYNDPGDGSTYNNEPVQYGTLTKLTLPTGGTISYTWETVNNGSEVCQNGGRWVASRSINANDGTGSHSWRYAYNSGDTVVTDPLLNDVVHTFGYSGGCGLYETETQYYQGSHTSGSLLKTVNTTYNGSTASENTYGYASSAPVGAINVVPTSVTTVWPNGRTSKVTKSYDSGYSYTDYMGRTTDLNGNPNVGIFGKLVSESDYDYPSGTSLLRTVTTVYEWQNNSSYLSNNLLNLPYSIQTLNGSGTQMAYTYYGYDESGGVVSSGVSEQKQGAESSPGNQTSIHHWENGSTTSTTNCNVSVSNGYLVSKNVFYDTGEINQRTDACGYSTTYTNSSASPYYGAFPTSVTNALGQITTFGYDSNTGAVTSIEDPNQQTTTKTYDVFTRLTLVNYPDGGSTNYCYTDMGGTDCSQSGAPYKVVKTVAISSSINGTSTAVVDGLGRFSQTQLNSDPSGTDYTLTTYDADGRKSEVYNPTRCSTITSNCDSETTWGYTTNSYDALARVTSVVEQDNSTVSTSYDTTPPSGYSGYCTTVTDEAGKSRQSCVDGLGRMTTVVEDPGSSPHLNFLTTYGYDALGNLTAVTQNGNNSGNARTRSFSYDSLSRLTSATNPELGTIGYTYDADGNVITKTAPSPNQPSTGTAKVTTTYTYDTLNRPTGKSYVDGYSSNPATPAVTYGYDGVNLSCPMPIGLAGTSGTNVIGRRSAMCYAAGNKSWTFDAMGRVHDENDRFTWIFPPYSPDITTYNGEYELSEDTQYDYYLNGDLNQLLYPGPHGPPDYEFYTIENAAGQITSAGDIYYTVLYDATYTPTGQLASAEVGWTDGGSNPNLISNT